MSLEPEPPRRILFRGVTQLVCKKIVNKKNDLIYNRIISESGLENEKRSLGADLELTDKRLKINDNRRQCNDEGGKKRVGAERNVLLWPNMMAIILENTKGGQKRRENNETTEKLFWTSIELKKLKNFKKVKDVRT